MFLQQPTFATRAAPHVALKMDEAERDLNKYAQFGGIPFDLYALVCLGLSQPGRLGTQNVPD